MQRSNVKKQNDKLKFKISCAFLLVLDETQRIKHFSKKMNIEY